MGYELSEEQVNDAFAKFKVLADKKKEVSDEDLLALLEEKLIDTPEVFAGNDLCCLRQRIHTDGEGSYCDCGAND